MGIASAESPIMTNESHGNIGNDKTDDDDKECDTGDPATKGGETQFAALFLFQIDSGRFE